MRDDEGALRSALPDGVRARIVRTGSGLDMHVLEAGFEEHGRPALLLLHGFLDGEISRQKSLRWEYIRAASTSVVILPTEFVRVRHISYN